MCMEGLRAWMLRDMGRLRRGGLVWKKQYLLKRGDGLSRDDCVQHRICELRRKAILWKPFEGYGFQRNCTSHSIARRSGTVYQDGKIGVKAICSI